MHTRVARLAPIGALCALIVAGGAAPVFAAEKSEPVTQTCIYSTTVRQTQILDDQTILFQMRDHTTYRNRLQSTCPGLRVENRFVSGKEIGNRLCEGSQIRVLVYTAFDNQTLGASCRLGTFEPLSDDEAATLIAAAKRKKGASNRPAVKAEPVESPPAAQSQPAATEPRVPAAAPSEPPPVAEPAR